MIERTGDCAAEPGAFEQARAEIALLKQELALTVRQRQQLERDLDAHMQAWSQGLQQRFQHDRAARLRAWDEVSSALLVCLGP